MKKISLIALFAALVMSVNATDIWTGSKHVSWEDGGVQIAAEQFANAQPGQKIVLHFTDATDGVEFKVMNENFDHLAGSREAAWISGNGIFEQFLTQEAVVTLKAHGLEIIGANFTCTQVELVAQDIIDGIEGNTESVQQNTEDGDYTIAILTEKEYCIVYRGDDDRVYVQVSPRKYAYTSDKEPYHSRAGTYRYFRRFYYSRGYGSDSSTYSNSTSSYYGYSDGTIDYNSNNSLNSYSQNVRQESINSRSSDGGGLSSGK